MTTAQPQLPAGTVTFLFTDIEGSTKLLQRLGDDYARVLGEHQALLRAAWVAHGGAEIDTAGDGFFVAFASAPEAVAAATDATRALADHAWPEGGILHVRIGLHTGTPQLVGDHYVGLDVHRAARIAAAGHGGQMLLSQTTRDLVAQHLSAGAMLRDLGAHRLKDLQHPEELYQLVLPGLPSDFPPLKTLDTYQHNLPLQPTPLLGREQQVSAVSMLLSRPDVRLVTLTGPGGIGKTRLSIQVAAEMVGGFAGGVWLVRLSRLTDPTLVVPIIAETLGLREQGIMPIAEALREHLRSRQLLLVLDNFEQVVGAAPGVGALLEASAGLKVLVTSRIPLRLRGERAYAVPTLPLAEPREVNTHTPEQLTQYAAVALFVERAREARSDFAVTSANAPAIAEVCARLDGLPLAIELAASRVRVLPPEALLARLSAQLKLLTGGARDAEERQQTMRATIAWSEGLLTPAERVLLRRLAVFMGGCTLEATEAICAAPTGAEPLGSDVLEGLSTLVDHSLVQQREEGGEPRFGMLHVIREFALEQLEASGEDEALRRAHAAYFLGLAEAVEPERRGPLERTYMERLEREQDNLRAALGWTRERGEVEIGLRLATSLWGFWSSHGQSTEGRAWLEGLLALAGPDAPGVPAMWARAYFAAGMAASWQSDYTAAAARLETSLVLAREAGDERATGWALTGLGQVAGKQGEHTRAERFLEEAMAFARTGNQTWGMAMVLNELALEAYYQGDLDTAQTRAEEAVRLYQETGNLSGAATALDTLVRVVVRQGNTEQAAALGREVLSLWQQLGTKAQYAGALEMAAMIVGTAGNSARAARLLGAAAAIRATVQVPWPDEERTDILEAVAAARVALGEEQWAAAFAAGQALSPEEAIAEALGDGE